MQRARKKIAPCQLIMLDVVQAYFYSVPGYQTYLQSIASVLRFTVLDFDYQALSQVRISKYVVARDPSC